MKLDVCIDVITSKTKVTVETVASSSTLVANATVGACNPFLVNAINWERILSRDGAFDVSFGSIRVGNSEQRLTTRCTWGPCNELDELLLSGVVTVSEKDFDYRLFVVALIDVNFNLRDGEVGESFQSILNRIGVLTFTHTNCIDLNRTSIILPAKLISKSQVEETLLHSRIFELA